MSQSRRAVIDVGTNSVKLLVADVDGNDVRPVLEDSKQSRLGQGFYETQRLQPAAIERTADAVAKFADMARSAKVQSIRVIATSAARDAVNPDELISAVMDRARLPVEIISGDQEADWAFKGVTTDPQLARVPLLLLDVGGGSTEFILGRGDEKHFRSSFSLGTVRLLEKMPHSDPPTANELDACRKWLREFLQSNVRPELDPALQRETRLDPRHREVQLVGTGGTATILARMEIQTNDFDREQIESKRLSLERLKWHVGHLWQLTVEERRHIVGLPPKRADVILLGVAIYEVVMVEFGFDELRVSTRGLRFAALMEG